MKITQKRFPITIFFLSILFTAVGWFTPYKPFGGKAAGTYRGLPLPYWISSDDLSKYPDAQTIIIQVNWLLGSLFVDLLFWALVVAALCVLSNKLKVENKRLRIGFIVTLMVIFTTLLSFSWRIPKWQGRMDAVLSYLEKPRVTIQKKVVRKGVFPKKEKPAKVLNGETYKDYRRCASENPIQKDSCYKLSAIVNNDTSICSFIEDTSTTQYLRNDCVLITEAVNSSVLPLVCGGLDENSCNEQEGCLSLYIAPSVVCPSAKPDCVKKTYSGCGIDARFFCTKSGGSLDQKYGCVCPEDKTLIDPYGCFDCDDFSVPEAKQECLRRSKPKKDNSSKKKTLLMSLELGCKGKYDGGLWKYLHTDLESVNDLVTVFIHSKNKPTVLQVSELEKLEAIPYLEQTWVPPLKDHPTGFFIAKIPAKKLPDVCSLQFIERLSSAEDQIMPQLGPK